MNLRKKTTVIDWTKFSSAAITKWLQNAGIMLQGSTKCTDEEYLALTSVVSNVNIASAVLFMSGMARKQKVVSPMCFDPILSHIDSFTIIGSETGKISTTDLKGEVGGLEAKVGKTEVRCDYISEGKEKRFSLPCQNGYFDTTNVPATISPKQDYSPLACELVSSIGMCTGIVAGKFKFLQLLDQNESFQGSISNADVGAAKVVLGSFDNPIPLSQGITSHGPECADILYPHFSSEQPQDLVLATSYFVQSDPPKIKEKNASCYKKGEYDGVRFEWRKVRPQVRLDWQDAVPEQAHLVTKIAVKASGGRKKFAGQYSRMIYDGAPLGAQLRTYVNVVVDLEQCNLKNFRNYALDTSDTAMVAFIFNHLHKTYGKQEVKDPRPIVIYMKGTTITPAEMRAEIISSGGVVVVYDWTKVPKDCLYVRIVKPVKHTECKKYTETTKQYMSLLNDTIEGVSFTNWLIKVYMLSGQNGAICTDSFKGYHLMASKGVLKNPYDYRRLLSCMLLMVKFAITYKYHRNTYMVWAPKFNLAVKHDDHKAPLLDYPKKFFRIDEKIVGLSLEVLDPIVVSNEIMLKGWDDLDHSLSGKKKKKVTIEDQPELFERPLRKNRGLVDVKEDEESFLIKNDGLEDDESVESFDDAENVEEKEESDEGDAMAKAMGVNLC